MIKSCLHSELPTKHSEEHMTRRSKVTYLIDPSSTYNEYWYNKKLPKHDEFIRLAKLSYAKWVKQKMQKSQIKALIKEAVINLHAHHSLKDVKRVMFIAGKVLGGYVPFQIAVHKDEGVFVEYVGKLKDEWCPEDYIYNSKNFKWYEKEKDGKAGKEVTNIISFRPSRDYHYNNIDQEWYEDLEFTKKANLSNKHIWYNYHAHVIYSTFNLNTGRGRNNREEMRSLQTLVANGLEMERGERFSKTRRQTHWQRKAESDVLNDEKREHEKTKQKSNALIHENTINKNQTLLQNRMLKDLKDDFEKYQINIESYVILKTEHKRLQNLLNCGDDMSIEEGIQKIKEESQKIIDGLKAELENDKKSIEDLSNMYESQISKLEEKVEGLTEDVYSDHHIYLKKKKTIFRYKYKNLISGKEKIIERQKSKIEELEKQLNPTGYEIEGASVTKAVYDYVKSIEEIAKNEKNLTLVLANKVEKQSVEKEDLRELVNSNTSIYKEKSENQLKEINKLEKKVKELEKENSLQFMDIEQPDKLEFYEKDECIDELDDYETDKFSYKSENENLQKELNARESELELVNKILKTVMCQHLFRQVNLNIPS